MRPARDDERTAEFIAFEEFSSGLPHGRFHVVVNPALVQPFVARRVNAVPVAIALLGIGIACVLADRRVLGVLLVALGLLWRRAIQWQAAKILLHLARRQPSTYYDATTQGVMEVQRSG